VANALAGPPTGGSERRYDPAQFGCGGGLVAQALLPALASEARPAERALGCVTARKRLTNEAPNLLGGNGVTDEPAAANFSDSAKPVQWERNLRKVFSPTRPLPTFSLPPAAATPDWRGGPSNTSPPPGRIAGPHRWAMMQACHRPSSKGYPRTTDTSPCSLPVGLMVISTSWPREARKSIRRSTEKLPDCPRMRPETWGCWIPS
jgi:hypothetical protein